MQDILTSLYGWMTPAPSHPLKEQISDWQLLKKLLEIRKKPQTLKWNVNMEINVEGVAKLMHDRVTCYHRLPEKVISDWDKRYSENFMMELYKLLGIKVNVSTAFRLQTNRQTEWVNQEIEQYLQIFINYHQTDWSDWLAMAEFSYNDKVNASTKHTPLC
jgi:hypothetical protein